MGSLPVMSSLQAVTVGMLWLHSLSFFTRFCLAHTAPVSSPAAPSILQYDYSDGKHGPAHWGELTSNWSLCKTGTEQSPLAITSDIVSSEPSLGILDAMYTSQPVNASISNNGHTVSVKVSPEAGELRISNVTYYPKDFHFHAPSEHKILDKRFPMELHMVHQSADSKIAVIALLFTHGDNDTFLAQFYDNLPSYRKPGVESEIGSIKPPDFKKYGYGRYKGSLTTPPCSEEVAWTVMLWDFPTISEIQLKQLQESKQEANARPSQPCNGRTFRINT